MYIYYAFVQDHFKIRHFNPEYRSNIILLIRALSKIFTYDKTQKCVWFNCCKCFNLMTRICFTLYY